MLLLRRRVALLCLHWLVPQERRVLLVLPGLPGRLERLERVRLGCWVLLLRLLRLLLRRVPA